MESEFQSQQTKIQELNQKLRDDQQHSDQASNAELERMRTNLKTKDDEIFVLNKTLDDLEAKYHTQEEELGEKHKCVTDLEIILVDYERKLEDYEACKKELESSLSIMHEQEIDYQMLKKECDQFKAVCNDFSSVCVCGLKIRVLLEKSFLFLMNLFTCNYWSTLCRHKDFTPFVLDYPTIVC